MTDALQQYLDSVRTRPFKWGEHDCAMFAANGVDAKFGTEFSRAVRAFGVTSARNYRRMQRAGMDLAALTCEVLGPPAEHSPSRGDVVLVRTVAGSVLGIAAPPVVLCADRVGFSPVPLSAVRLVWKVG